MNAQLASLSHVLEKRGAQARKLSEADRAAAAAAKAQGVIPRKLVKRSGGGARRASGATGAKVTKGKGKKTSKAGGAQKGGRKRRAVDRRIVINLANCAYPIVRNAAKRRNWRAARPGEAWDIDWSDGFGALTDPKLRLNGLMRLNHFPAMQNLARKDFLANNLKVVRKAMLAGECVVSSGGDGMAGSFDFAPASFVLPRELAEMQKHMSAALKTYRHEKKKAQKLMLRWKRMRRDAGSQAPAGTRPPPPPPLPAYISKPRGGSQGKGIAVHCAPLRPKALERLCAPDVGGYVVQQYIPRPLLVDGYKFDLRVCVALRAPR